MTLTTYSARTQAWEEVTATEQQQPAAALAALELTEEVTEEPTIVDPNE